ncbi:MAG TPA: hypothetical protein VFW27_21695 [Actinoplanes sp.]|jgi:hypothetical protein|nr:hypothetical protein [Actinoplanes sp.]
MTMRPLRRVTPGRVVVVKAPVILAAIVLALAGLVAACGPEQAADRRSRIAARARRPPRSLG